MTDTTGLNAFDERTRKLVEIKMGKFRAQTGPKSADEAAGRAAAARNLDAGIKRAALQMKYGLTRGQVQYWIAIVRRERRGA